ncbi:MAG: sigma factor G inhibitor Gin [Firmicutes bacterium]|nr:sigma factor G inhibitor Gin [Bacillota bacterium]
MPDEKRAQCLICGREQAQGMHIFSHLICAQCEAQIVSTDVDDEMYRVFVERLRTLWEDLVHGDRQLDAPVGECPGGGA